MSREDEYASDEEVIEAAKREVERWKNLLEMLEKDD